jgi:hypothetical protein
LKENTEFLHPGDPLEDRESIPLSMSHSLDSESDPAYSPSSRSHSSLGSDSSLSCHVDVEPVKARFLSKMCLALRVPLPACQIRVMSAVLKCLCEERESLVP